MYSSAGHLFGRQHRRTLHKQQRTRQKTSTYSGQASTNTGQASTNTGQTPKNTTGSIDEHPKRLREQFFTSENLFKGSFLPMVSDLSNKNCFPRVVIILSNGVGNMMLPTRISCVDFVWICVDFRISAEKNLLFEFFFDSFQSSRQEDSFQVRFVIFFFVCGVCKGQVFECKNAGDRLVARRGLLKRVFWAQKSLLVETSGAWDYSVRSWNVWRQSGHPKESRWYFSAESWGPWGHAVGSENLQRGRSLDEVSWMALSRGYFERLWSCCCVSEIVILWNDFALRRGVLKMLLCENICA